METDQPKSIRKRKRKVRRGPVEGLPFPNYLLRNLEEQTPTVCNCEFDGKSFLVSSPGDIATLYENGAFGRSTLTKRSPVTEDNAGFERKPYFQKLVKEMRPVITKFRFDSSSPGSPPVNDTSQETKDLPASTVPDEMDSTSAESAIAATEMDKVMTEAVSSEPDKLELFAEEVFFLTFAIGCLLVTTTGGKKLNSQDLWQMFCELKPDFPALYAVYHHLRCKNWVPKSGRSYGGDYVLYEKGPEHFHSLYIVHIFSSTKPGPTWMELCARQRLASHAAKVALICEVDIPSNFHPMYPHSIFQLKIHETSLFRWQPSYNK